MLPRESNSKFTDVSLLPTLMFPFFAGNDIQKSVLSLKRAKEHLERCHGYIRFNKDGFGCVLEDNSRPHYRPQELKSFDGVDGS